MSDMSDFFSTGGGLWAKPPRRVLVPGFQSTTTETYGNPLAMPCRQGAGRFWALPAIAGTSLALVDVATGAVVASINPFDILAQVSPGKSVFNGALHYDDIAGSLYVVVINTEATPASFQLAKIDDVSGAMTKVGGVGTVGNNTYWGALTSVTSTGIVTSERVSNQLRFRFDGRETAVDLTTGALVYEGQLPVLLDGTVCVGLGASYVTADRTAAFLSQVSALDQTGMAYGFARAGLCVRGVVAPWDGVGVMSGGWIIRPTSGTWVGFAKSVNSSTKVYGWRFFDGTDYDRYVQDLITAVGVL